MESEFALSRAGAQSRAVGAGRSERPLLLCLSHLRWKFVWQRPQHILSRAAATHDVIFVEEPVDADLDAPRIEIERHDGMTVARPVVPRGLSHGTRLMIQEALLNRLVGRRPIAIAWFYTPMALEFARRLDPDIIVYDNMDELALFHGADSRIALLENELLSRADVVFTGGHSLWEAKRHRHGNIHAVPSSVDVAHFAQARGAARRDPEDQAAIARPRVGFFGVIDERMDVGLVGALADLRPDLQFVMLGPVVKIDPATLPRRPNLHWLGGKDYKELPKYLAGWDCGFMPFALNDATRFISPTKTPEFLAAGLPVVSTAIRDVVQPYGAKGLVGVADTPSAMSAAIDAAIAQARDPAWRAAVATHLATMSWDRTWAFMQGQIEALDERQPAELADA
jgi:glycosyltransferase involved in cell wall biosynthesis